MQSSKGTVVHLTNLVPLRQSFFLNFFACIANGVLVCVAFVKGDFVFRGNEIINITVGNFLLGHVIDVLGIILVLSSIGVVKAPSLVTFIGLFSTLA